MPDRTCRSDNLSTTAEGFETSYATNLLTHTQVLDETTAILTAPTPEGYAQGTPELAIMRHGR